MLNELRETKPSNTHRMLNAVIKDVHWFCDYIQESFPDYDFEVVNWGNWVRAFVLYDGVQLGRINFEPSENGGYKFYSIRHYKPRDMEYEAEDLIFHALEYWLQTGIILDVDRLVMEAKREVNEKRDAQLKWRAENPLPIKEKIVNGVVVKVQRKRKSIKTHYMNRLRMKIIQLSNELLNQNQLA